MAFKLMTFDFDIMYMKGNIISQIDALFRREFGNKKVENYENAEDKILHWVETDVLPLNRYKIETSQDLILIRDTREIKGKYMEQLLNGTKTP